MGETENMVEAESTAETAAQSPRQLLLAQIGQKLIQAREAREEQLSVITRKLRLSKAHLQALEAGNWDELPDDIYALGFLRQYSKYLALDLDDDIQRIKHDQYVLTRPLTFPDLPVAPSYKWAWIAGTAFVILFVAFNIVNRDAVWDLLIAPKSTSPTAEQAESDPPPPSRAASADAADAVTFDNIEDTATGPTQEIENAPLSPIPETLPAAEQSSTDTLSTSEAAIEASPELASANSTAATVDDSTSTATKPLSDIPEDSSPDAEATARLTTADAAAEKADLTTESGETAELADNNVAIHHYRFEAVEESVWLQIFLPDETGEAKGAFLKEVLLQPGYHANIKEAADSLWITCGNPVALRIKVDGQVLAKEGSLGETGKVLRDYQFRIDRQNSN